MFDEGMVAKFIADIILGERYWGTCIFLSLKHNDLLFPLLDYKNQRYNSSTREGEIQ